MYTPITARDLKVGDSFTYRVQPGKHIDRVDGLFYRDVEGEVLVQILYVRNGKAAQMTVPAMWSFYRVDPDVKTFAYGLSDTALAADITLLERSFDQDWAAGDAPDYERYRDLVTERHARTVLRGKAQAELLDAIGRKLESGQINEADTATSGSVQYFIETGKYLTWAESFAQQIREGR